DQAAGQDPGGHRSTAHERDIQEAHRAMKASGICRMLTITFHGHACFTLEPNGHRLVLDPFLTGNPAADIPVDRLAKVDAVLLSHGHGDHLGDAIPIATRDGATIVATAELAK